MLCSGVPPRVRMTPKLPHITVPNGFQELAEVVYSGFTFALLDDTNTALHKPCQCKDYFQDLFWSEHHNDPVEIYGFSWIPGTINKNSERFAMALTYNNTIRAQRDALQQFLNIFDNALGFTPTVLENTDRLDTLRMTFSGHWTRSAPLMSAFTTLVRLGYSYTADMPISQYFKQVTGWCNDIRDGRTPADSPVNRPDTQRFNHIRPRLEKLLTGFVPKSSYESIHSAHTAHNLGLLGSTPAMWK